MAIWNIDATFDLPEFIFLGAKLGPAKLVSRIVGSMPSVVFGFNFRSDCRFDPDRFWVFVSCCSEIGHDGKDCQRLKTDFKKIGYIS